MFWGLEPQEDREVTHLYLPEPGFVTLTKNGLYHPSGFPFETVETREEAEKSLTDIGFSPEFAGKAVGRFWSRGERHGVDSVNRTVSNLFGRFSLFADRYPHISSGDVGRLPVIRE